MHIKTGKFFSSLIYIYIYIQLLEKRVSYLISAYWIEIRTWLNLFLISILYVLIKNNNLACDKLKEKKIIFIYNIFNNIGSYTYVCNQKKKTINFGFLHLF